MGTIPSKPKRQERIWHNRFLDPSFTYCDGAALAPPPLPPVTSSSSSSSTTTTTTTTTTTSSSSNEKDAPPPPPDVIEEAARVASSITNPGPYEQASMDAKRLVTIDAFDGMRFDINKQLSPFMAVIHSFWLGTSMIPDGRNKSYTFMTQVANESGLLLARVDFDRGSVDGRIHRALLGGLALAKLQVGVSASDGQQDQCMGELDINGATWSGNLKYGSVGGGLLFGMNYFQSITPNLALGGEGLYVSANQNLVSTYTIKYSMPEDSKTEWTDPPDTTPSSTFIANYQASQGLMTLHYRRLVTPNRVTLGAELQFSPLTLDSQVMLGAEFKLTRSKVAVCVDGSGKVQSVVEAKLGRIGAPTLQFSAEMDHAKDVMRFGYGLNIEG